MSIFDIQKTRLFDEPESEISLESAYLIVLCPCPNPL